jgi:hypothetical protein
VLKFLDGFAPQQGQQFEFLAVGGIADLSGATFEVQNLMPGFQFDITPSAGGVLMTALTDGRFVPEPPSVLLLLIASIGLRGVYRRRAGGMPSEVGRRGQGFDSNGFKQCPRGAPCARCVGSPVPPYVVNPEFFSSTTDYTDITDENQMAIALRWRTHASHPWNP